MKQTDNRARSVAITRAVTRAEFLRLVARVAGACAAGNVCTPEHIARTARDIGRRHRLRVSVFGRREITRLDDLGASGRRSEERGEAC